MASRSAWSSAGRPKAGLDLVCECRNLQVLVIGARASAVELVEEAVAQLRPIGECGAGAAGCGVLAETGADHDGAMAGQKSVGDRVEERAQRVGNPG